MAEKKEATKANDKDNKDAQPKQTNDDKKKGTPKAKSEPVKVFSLTGKKEEQKKAIIEEAIDYHKKELNKWIKKQQELNKKFMNNDLSRYNIEDVEKWLEEQKKKKQQQ